MTTMHEVAAELAKDNIRPAADEHGVLDHIVILGEEGEVALVLDDWHALAFATRILNVLATFGQKAPWTPSKELRRRPDATEQFEALGDV